MPQAVRHKLNSLDNSKSLERGFTLTEMVIVLGISTVIIGSIWVAGANLWLNFRVNQTQRYILQIVQNVRDYYATRPAQLIGDTLTQDQRNIIPTELRVDKSQALGQLRHPFGGAMAVFSGLDADPTTNDLNLFRIRLNDIPVEACVKLVMLAPANVQEAGLAAFWVFRNTGGVVASNTVSINARGMGTSNGTNLPLPLGVSTARIWCAATDGKPAIVYQFRIRV